METGRGVEELEGDEGKNKGGRRRLEEESGGSQRGGRQREGEEEIRGNERS